MNSEQDQTTDLEAPEVERPEDRRAAPRYDCELRTEIRHGDKVIQGKISNLSVVGARVDTEAELEDEAELEINLILSVVDEESEPHSDVIAVVATVVWILESDDSGYTSGLRFDIMGPHELERLRRVLRALAAN